MQCLTLFSYKKSRNIFDFLSVSTVPIEYSDYAPNTPESVRLDLTLTLNTFFFFFIFRCFFFKCLYSSFAQLIKKQKSRYSHSIYKITQIHFFFFILVIHNPDFCVSELIRQFQIFNFHYCELHGFMHFPFYTSNKYGT